MRARGGSKVVINGSEYPVLLTLSALAKTEADCGLASVLQVPQGLAYRSSGVVMFMLKHCLEAAGMDAKKADGLLDDVALNEIDAIIIVMGELIAPLFPKKKLEDQEASNQE
jgi:hypothetical protein